MSGDSVNDLRLKIKKLKYKIEKQQQSYNELNQSIDRFKTISKNEISLERVFKKINFLLQLKGLNFVDWINATSYDAASTKEQVNLNELLLVLQKMGIKLQAGQRSILINFSSAKMSQIIQKNQIMKFAQKFGIRTTE